MEYVYMKQERPIDAKGVEVTISVIDPNGNYYNVGTATSDINGVFKMAFTPEVAGTYSVIATFAGTGSYYGSHAETAIYVDEAVVTPAPTETPQSAVDLYFLPAVIGIIVAIFIAAVVIVLVLKKKP
jgi:hypothetical protein